MLGVFVDASRGVETVLFYAGILPSITMSEFVLGIAVVLGVLFVGAVVMVVMMKSKINA